MKEMSPEFEDWYAFLEQQCTGERGKAMLAETKKMHIYALSVKEGVGDARDVASKVIDHCTFPKTEADEKMAADIIQKYVASKISAFALKGGEKVWEGEPLSNTPRMLRVDGKRFKCPCGCNVFHDAPSFEGKEVCACNTCGAEFVTDRDRKEGKTDDV